MAASNWNLLASHLWFVSLLIIEPSYLFSPINYSYRVHSFPKVLCFYFYFYFLKKIIWGCNQPLWLTHHKNTFPKHSISWILEEVGTPKIEFEKGPSPLAQLNGSWRVQLLGKASGIKCDGGGGGIGNILVNTLGTWEQVPIVFPQHVPKFSVCSPTCSQYHHHHHHTLSCKCYN